MKERHTQLLFQQLESEAAQRAALQEASTEVNQAERELYAAEKSLSGLAKWAPKWTGIGSAQKAEIEKAQARLRAAKQEAGNIQKALWNTQNALDVLMFNKLRADDDPEFRKSEEMRGFYTVARKRIEVFQTCVSNFLKSLGQTRGAMSASYNAASKQYSDAAKERMRESIREAQKLDMSLEDLLSLSEEFKEKSRGTRYASIHIPTFAQVGYEKFVRDTIKEPIGPAQIAFECTLAECEQLKDEGIEDALDQVDHAESLHKEITDELVRRAWEELQKSHLRSVAAKKG